MWIRLSDMKYSYYMEYQVAMNGKRNCGVGSFCADSGRSTLLDEIRAEGDGSPLPSGIWTSSSSPVSNPIPNETNIISNVNGSNQESKNEYGSASQNGNSIGKNGSSCCTENVVKADSSSPPYRRNRRHQSSENTYRSFEYGEDGDLYEALNGSGGNCGRQLGNRKSGAHPEDESENGMDSLKENTFYPHRTFKVILAGDAAVGKTTFIERICYGHFTPNLSSTIGNDGVLFYLACILT